VTEIANRPHAPATLRNREPILKALRGILPSSGLLLEIASGTGEHAAYIAPRLAEGWIWQPSEPSPDALPVIDAYAAESDNPGRICPAIFLDMQADPWPLDHADAVFCANMIHIAPWRAAEGLFRGASGILATPAPLILYGPFKRDGAHTAPSNAAFDDSLKARNPEWGVRCLDREVTPLAQRHGFARTEIVPMPANNLVVVFRKTA
jgi:SAM-dependent methyltransferase